MRHYPFRPIRHLVVALCAVVAAAILAGQPAAPVFAQAGNVDPATQRLFDAIHAKDFAAAQASVEDGAHVDVPGRWGMTAIELAIDKGYFKIAHYLVAVRNFQSDGNESKSRRVATPSAPVPGIQGELPTTQAEEGQTHVPAVGAATASPAVPTAGHVTASPNSVPSQPVGTPTDQPFYAPLAELETTGGRDAETDSAAWPVDKPNPFDPGMPAVGSSLQIIGEIGTADPGIAFRPAGEFGQPTLETETLPSQDTPSPPSTVEASDASPAGSGGTKKSPGLGGGIIGETSDFQYPATAAGQ